MTPRGRIFDISRGCVDDGPGLRTVVFLKGCALGCPWCQNPEGISSIAEVFFDPARCIGCGECQRACPREWKGSDWRHGCRALGKCVEACPAKARRLVGRDVGVEELVAEVRQEQDFLTGTGGGVTFSGGEPLAQPEFVLLVAEELRRRSVHLALETAGFWPERLVPEVARFDLVLFDLKHVDRSKFQRAIGKGNSLILDNLRALLASPVILELRLTLVPGFNDGESDLLAIANFLKSCPRLPAVTLQPFHRLANAKQALLGRPYPFAAAPLLTGDQLALAAEVLRGGGITLGAGTKPEISGNQVVEVGRRLV